MPQTQRKLILISKAKNSPAETSHRTRLGHKFQKFYFLIIEVKEPEGTRLLSQQSHQRNKKETDKILRNTTYVRQLGEKLAMGVRRQCEERIHE